MSKRGTSERLKSARRAVLEELTETLQVLAPKLTQQLALQASKAAASVLAWASSDQRYLSPYCLPRSQRLPYHQNRPQ